MRANFTLKSIVPRGLYGRAALILLVPIVTVQLVVSVVFIQRYYDSVTRQMTDSLLLELREVVRRVEAAPSPDAARRAAAPLTEALNLTLRLPDPDAPAADRRDMADLTGRALIDALHGGLTGLRGVDLTENDDNVHLGIATRHGMMALEFRRTRVTARNPHQLLVWMLGTGVLITMIAFVFLRNQMRPITRLADAAEAFGKGRVIDYRPAGAREVRAAGAAFLEMRARILRHIEQRTLILSGVSHDLRSPLTRLRLALSMGEETEDSRAMIRDLEEMEETLDRFLDFARGDTLDEPAEVDAGALLARCVAHLREPGRVELTAPPAELPAVMLRPAAVERALINLLQNALRHGVRVRAGLELRPGALVVSIEDDGPGIPPERREEALRPFIRLDAARNQDRGTGVGLGLAIAADIARRHGGALHLGESADLGGLSARFEVAR